MSSEHRDRPPPAPTAPPGELTDDLTGEVTGPSSGESTGDERFRLLVESVLDYAIFMLDPQGVVQTWNAGAQRLKGYTADEIIGQRFHVFYTPESIARGWPDEELRLAAAHGRVEDEGWRLRKDGQPFWASVVITALRDATGRLTGYAKVTRDLTERRAQEEALRQSEEQMRLLVGAVQDYAIFMLDPEGRVLSWNTGAQQINGYSAAEVLGEHFSVFFTATDVAAGLPQRELELARLRGRAETEGWRVRKSGDQYWVNAVITAIIGADGTLRGFAKVTRDLTEQRRLQQLEHASRRMEEFLAMLAHELRNPLAPLRNATQIMALKGELPAYMGPIRDMIERQVNLLTRLVDDLLDVARITTGKISLQHERLDFRTVVLASVEALRAQISRKSQQLTIDLPADDLWIHGDAARLTQALQNLLSNAHRYTPERGRIEIRVRRQGDSLLASVVDSGIGLPPEAHERIFHLFTQEPITRDPSDSGLGIGLSLSRKIAELHGGTLTAFSEGPGRGSTFTLLIPGEAASRDEPPPTEAAAAPALSRRVLVIDDNADSARSMVGLLKLLGHEARGALSGSQGLATATGFEPDVVLLDLNMPEMDGFEVMRALRARFGHSQRIVALTGYGQQDVRRAALDSGFDEHLVKPVGVEQLQSAISPARSA